MASSTKRPFEVSDFSGGITDNIFDGNTKTAQYLDNFTILPDRHLLSRPGSTVDDASHSPIPSGNTRIGALINYAKNDNLFVQSGANFYYRPGGSGAYSTLLGPSSNPVLNAGSTTNSLSFAEWNKQLFVTSDAFPNIMKLYKDGSNVYQVRNAGMPALASSPTVTAGAASTHSYVYAFVYSYTYTVMTQTFKEISAVTLVTLSSAEKPDSSSVSISAIPVLTNSGGQNYDTTVIKCEIYRTIDNGTNFYFVGQVTNGTTTFTDSVSDTTLQTHLALYINDGTLDWNAPPNAKYIHVVGNVGFLGYTKDSNGEHPFRIQQSYPGNVNFWPSGFTLDVGEQINGIKSVANLPIAFGIKKVFRIDGLFDGYGRNGMSAVQIHASAGCVAHRSCVEAEGMLYWFGNDGVYTTDGYTVTKVSDHLNDRYQSMLSATSNTARIYGKFDEVNRRIQWCVEQSSTNLENDTLLTLDLRWGVSTQMCFYTWSGTSFRPTAIEIFKNYLYRADQNGFVFKHDPTVFTDPQVNTSVSSSTWNLETVIWNYVSGQFDFGSSFFRKFVSRILLQAGNVGDTTIQITAFNDQGKVTRNLKPIRWRRNLVWRLSPLIWGSANCLWAAVGLIDQWRRFPAGGLRLSYLQLQITNGFGIVANSDDYGLATVDPTAKTAQLPGGNNWPTNPIGYYLTLVNDNYQRQYLVTGYNGTDTITVSDSGNNLPLPSTYQFELFGYAKGETLNLLGYNLHWNNVDQNNNTFQVGDDGGN